MAAKAKSKTTTRRRRIESIVRDLAELEARIEELKRERRLAALRMNDDVLRRWLDMDTESRRWNVSTPPLRAHAPV
jgi:hypothetical protein